MKRAIRGATIALAAVATMVNSWDARHGGWIYDDAILRGNTLLDDRSDLLGILGRTSRDYQLGHDPTLDTLQVAFTWRPITIATLFAVNLIGGRTMFWHHAVSWAIHLLVVCVLAWLMVPSRKDESFGPWRALALLTFALHPALGEAWMWVNGRSDALAGLCLAVFALLVRRSSDARSNVALGLLTVFGAMCKESFVITAAAVLLATDLGLGRREGARARWGAWACGSAIYGVGWWWATADSEPMTLTVFAARDARFAARLVALGMETLLLPQSRGMRLLEWTVRTPWSPTEIGSLGLFAAGIVWSVWRRQWALLTLWVGAAVSLLPCVLLTQGFWLGLDRYLYQPAVMGLMVFGLQGRPALRIGRPLALAGAAVVVFAVGGVQWVSSYCYRSNVNFGRCMMEARPKEPTGYYLAAAELVERDDPWTDVMLSSAARARMPEGIAHRVFVLLLRRHLLVRADRILASARRVTPASVQLALDLVALRVAQERWPETLDAALRVEAMPSMRPQLAARRLAEALALVPTQAGPPDPVSEGIRAVRTRAERRAQGEASGARGTTVDGG